jgi:hypothetical protein
MKNNALQETLIIKFRKDVTSRTYSIIYCRSGMVLSLVITEEIPLYIKQNTVAYQQNSSGRKELYWKDRMIL